jgi:Bacterial PH domain
VEIETFTISRGQTTELGIFAAVILGIGAVLLVFAFTGSYVSRPALGFGSLLAFFGLLAAYLTLAYTRAYTEISADGIRTRHPFGTKHVAWPDVKDIKVDALQKRTLHVIEIVRRNGRSFQLGAPVDSPIMSDPDFKAKLERIAAAWRQMTVAAGN